MQENKHVVCIQFKGNNEAIHGSDCGTHLYMVAIVEHAYATL
jgi:hypothetical protein